MLQVSLLLSWINFENTFNHCIKHRNFTKFPGVEILRNRSVFAEFWENPQQGMRWNFGVWHSNILAITDLASIALHVYGQRKQYNISLKKNLLKSEIHLLDPLFYKTCRCRCYDRGIPVNFWKFKNQVHYRAVFRTLPCIYSSFWKK